jgi:tRNA 2-thiouridine synthesizing protein A
MTFVQATVRIDARGLQCPMPIVKAAQAVRDLPSGSVLEILATDPGSTKDFAAWCRSTGHQLLEASSTDGVFRFVIQRK